MGDERKSPVIIPLFIAIGLYLSAIIGVFYYVGFYDELVKRYTSKKDNFLEVTMVKREKKEEKPKKEKAKQALKKDEMKKLEPVKKEEVKTAIKERVVVKDLFGKIKTKDINLTKPIPVSKKDPTKQSRLKSSKKNKQKAKIDKKTKIKASKLASSLSFDSSPTFTKSSSSGVYDKFRGEVQEILDGFWNETIETESGAEAKVKINIDKSGHFSYDIVNFSYNNEFNVKLRNFLEQMKSVTFPKNSDRVPDMTIKFTDRLER